MLAWVGDMCQPSHTLDLYRECLTAIKVRYGDTIGWYVNFIWVAHDIALTFEREIYGWPAHICDDARLAFHGSQITGACVRHGEQLMRVSFNATSVAHMGRTESPEENFGALLDGKFLQVRKFPAPAKEAKPIKQLLDIPTRDYTVHEIHEGNATVEMGHSGFYPTLSGLAPRETIGAWYVRASWWLDYPVVLWDNQK
jgi:acetoacetate decarboxylase